MWNDVRFTTLPRSNVISAGSGSPGVPVLCHIVPSGVVPCVCPTMPEPFTVFAAARLVNCDDAPAIAMPVASVSIGGAVATSLLNA